MKKVVLCLSFLVIFYITSSSQTYPYKNLVLEGGGVKGFAYAGAFQVLDSLGILQNIERVGGSSVGAIQATLLAIGYTPKEMMQLAAHIPLRQFNDGFIAGGFSRMKRKFGFFKGKKITTWIEQLIAAKTGDPDITFMQLHNLRPKKNYKDLYITGSDLTYRCLRTFSYESYPDMRIKDALRISFSIALYFEPVIIDDRGTVQKEQGNGTHLMVDGGLISNYPVQMFDSTRYFYPDSSMANYSWPNKATLGLLLDKPEQAEYGRGTYPLSIHSLRDYLWAVYQTIVDKPNPDVDDLRRTVVISHLNLSGRIRKLSAATIQRLVESGRVGVRRFFFYGHRQ